VISFAVSLASLEALLTTTRVPIPRTALMARARKPRMII
jgi:hypothetical protein